MFDNHPDNNRALFGGGRYNGLANLFEVEDFPSIGFAPGDEPMRLFLESYGMIEDVLEFRKEDIYYVPMIDETVSSYVYAVAQSLRKEGKSVVCGHVKQNIGKAIEYAEKGDFSHIVIVGAKEKENGKYKICEFRAYESVDLESVDSVKILEDVETEVTEEMEVPIKNSEEVLEKDIVNEKKQNTEFEINEGVNNKKEEDLGGEESSESNKSTVLMGKIDSAVEEDDPHFFDVEKDSK